MGGKLKLALYRMGKTKPFQRTISKDRSGERKRTDKMKTLCRVGSASHIGTALDTGVLALKKRID